MKIVMIKNNSLDVNKEEVRNSLREFESYVTRRDVKDILNETYFSVKEFNYFLKECKELPKEDVPGHFNLALENMIKSSLSLIDFIGSTGSKESREYFKKLSKAIVEELANYYNSSYSRDINERKSTMERELNKTFIIVTNTKNLYRL